MYDHVVVLERSDEKKKALFNKKKSLTKNQTSSPVQMKGKHETFAEKAGFGNNIEAFKPLNIIATNNTS